MVSPDPAYEVVNDPSAPAPAPTPEPTAPAPVDPALVSAPAPSEQTGAPAPDPTPTPVEQPAQAPASSPTPEQTHEYAREGAFVDVVYGEYSGLFGVYMATLERDADGTPAKILVRNRDHAGGVDLAVCDFHDVRPSARTGGR